jgi:hypothetical protein
MSDLRRRNGWTIAERSGDRTPDRTQRLLNRAVWDAFAAMRVVRRFAVAGLDEAARKTGRRSLSIGISRLRMRNMRPGLARLCQLICLLASTGLRASASRRMSALTIRAMILLAPISCVT